MWTTIGAVLMASAGFAIGALASAWQTRAGYAEPWHKMHVQHEGASGKPSRTRVIFDNPKLPLQAIELMRTADGAPSLAHISLREGEELTMEYDEKARPSSLTGPDGARARFQYEGDRTRVTFFSTDGTEVGTKRMTVPIQLLASAETASAGSPEGTHERGKLATVWSRVSSAFLGEAWAKEGEDEPITVTREVAIGLDVRVTGAGSETPAAAQIEASCAPIGCVPTKRELTAPGESDVRIAVSASVKKSSLAAPTGGQMDAFKEEARAERKEANRALPEVARVVGAVGLTAMACKSLSLASPICVKEFGTNAGSAGGALSSVVQHAIETDTSLIDGRAEQLFYEEGARVAIDKETSIEVCVSRDGFARVCTKINGRPFGATPMAKVARALELRRGVGGTLLGSFAMTQADGSDCKFSPSPRTSGVLRLTFDNERNTVSASLTANERGSRSNMGCSLGTANMGWFQNYSVTALQTFTKQQLGALGKLPLRLSGTMSGSGGYTFSNCRSSGGASAGCPGGKNDSYSYPVELIGSIDLDTHVGSGQIVVTGAPLLTQGTWRTPAEAKP